MIRITIPGKPAPMPRTRPRLDRAGRPVGAVWPKAYGQWRASVDLLVRAAARREQWIQLTGPVAVDVEAVWPRPKARPDWLPADVWSTGLQARRPVRPDGDNVTKTAADLLNGHAYRDDAQICGGETSCWVAAKGERPRMTITVRPLPWLRPKEPTGLHPATAALLAELAELHDVGGLLDCYGIDAGNDTPLDLAVREWAEAGYPDAPEED